jgi:hypothetical protein
VPHSARKILLAVNGAHPDARLFAAAANLAKRMSATLEILLQADKEVPPAPLENMLQQLTAEGVRHHLSQQETLSTREVVRYANTHECIACVVIDTPENWPGSSGAWEKLDCPLVVTAQHLSPSTSPQ